MEHSAVTAATPDPAAALKLLIETLRVADYHFITPTPASHARVNARPGNAWAQDLQGIFGWSRPFSGDLLPKALIEALVAAELLTAVPGGWRSRVRVSSLGDQLFVHSAYPTEDADAVFFGPDTYRYANALEAQLRHDTGAIRRAVDIGSGAGPGAVLVALARPDAEVLAVDINERALTLTRVNAELAGVDNLKACYSNLLKDVDGDFDFILSNPPYLVDPGERAYRHGGGPLGAGLSLAILDTALQRLAPGGTLLLYTGVAMVEGRDPFLEEVRARLVGSEVAWRYRELDPDVFGEELEAGVYAHTDRIAAVVLTVTRPA
ncbi:methyltransferase [Pseudomonas oryzihabitans]|uniref:methyltransferase n=1 Tax=Pseudomonas oryzihabitans TaxID=47885 RepID=UPI00289403CB|nr:methyltransferase [Pseudomonas oryzihabitans]MDT3720842.1 methyltransferase [Pseudomonas oryzihabitans]